MSLTTRSSLLQRVRDPRDSMSWSQFDRIYRQLLYKYARHRGLSREEAEDVVQDCMVLLSEKMRTFQYARAKGGFKCWLRRLANNRINDYLKKKRLPLARTADLRRPQEREESLDELWERDFREAHLKECLRIVRESVAPTTYQAFELRVREDWSVQKVAETLNISTDQVRAAKSRVIRRIRAEMRKLLGDEA